MLALSGNHQRAAEWLQRRECRGSPNVMSAADRDYDRYGNATPPGFLASLPPVVRWLLIANVGIYLADQAMQLAQGPLRPSLIDWGSFVKTEALNQGKVWQFLTFQFLHFGVVHILFNSVGLVFLGPWLERAWGGVRFLVYYLLCGVGGALFFCVLQQLHVVDSAPLVGASAGIYGILVGIAVIAPQQRVSLLFPPVTLTMRQLVLWTIGISAALIIFHIGGNGGGEAGHLGGILMGLLLAKFPQLLAWTARRGVEIHRPKRPVMRGEAKLRPRTDVNLAGSTEVDRILDKISQEGFQSLTEAERDLLQRVSQANQRK
ncbi:MAG: rhomboid family intramembrane serine protease [Luteolibacter sp.]